MKRIDEYEEKIYAAFYNDTMYAISCNLKILNRYMHKHRRLPKGKYTIMEYDPDNISITAHPELFLYEYNGVYITSRDICMCELFTTDLKTRMRNLNNELYEFAHIYGQLGKNRKQIEKLVDAANVVCNVYENKKLMEDMLRIDMIDNPVIYCDMQEYHKYLSMYSDYITAYNNW